LLALGACLTPAGFAPIAGAQSTIRIHIDGTVTGRDILGQEIPLGAGQFHLDLTVPDDGALPTRRPGQDEWSSAFSDFKLDTKTMGFPRGGMTVANFILAGREGEPNADFFNLGVFDCATTMCDFPIGTIGNSEVIGFEGLFASALLADGALGTEPFVTLADFMAFLDQFDMSQATDTLFNVEYVPAALLPIAELPGAGEGGALRADVLFVSVNGTITDIELVVPCPSDLDGDGAIGPSDLFTLLAQWGSPFGPADLFALLSMFGLSCP